MSFLLHLFSLALIAVTIVFVRSDIRPQVNSGKLSAPMLDTVEWGQWIVGSLIVTYLFMTVFTVSARGIFGLKGSDAVVKLDGRKNRRVFDVDIGNETISVRKLSKK